MRSRAAYAEGGPTPEGYVGFDPDVPVEGFYRDKLVTGGVDVAVHIWFGPPRDPVDGSELDRAPRWQSTINDKPCDIQRVWPRVAGKLITEAEAKHLTGLQSWGARNGHAELANPRKPIDPLTSPLMF